jgi:D-glycero-beta-D-manno-heptose 1-phosphate adenylyltransferase
LSVPDSDERIRELKGPTRPINNLIDRVDFLRAIKYIDMVVAFSSTKSLEAHIQWYSPDILLIGNDYIDKPIIGAQYAKEIVYFPRYGGSFFNKYYWSIVYTDMGIVDGLKETFEKVWLPNSGLYI